MYTHNQLPWSIILITIILIISFYIPTPHSQSDYYCINDRYSCGQNIQGIGYPFYGGDRPPACGFHGYELNCQHVDNTTTIRIDSQTFRVLSIEQNDNHTITLARNHLEDDVCPKESANIAGRNGTLFYYTGETVQFLNLSYYCPSFINISSRNSIGCSILDGRGRIETGFYIDESIWSSVQGRRFQPCRTNITVPVNQTAFEEFRRNDEMSLRELLEEGFQVEYRYYSRPGVSFSFSLAMDKSGHFRLMIQK